jgi:hypothetical protein
LKWVIGAAGWTKNDRHINDQPSLKRPSRSQP